VELKLYDGDLRPEYLGHKVEAQGLGWVRTRCILEPTIHFREAQFKHFTDRAQTAIVAAGRAVYWTFMGSYPAYHAVFPPRE
jgi:hypothetical protein